MVESESTNTHLHKVLRHRNHMHYVALQKQLNTYDRQKKLVEKELLQITKVRSAIQQINRRLPKKSPTIKKREITPNCSSENSKYNPPLVTEKGKAIDKRKDTLRKKQVIEGGKIGQSNINEVCLLGQKEENINHLTQSTVTAAMDNQVETQLTAPSPETNHLSEIIDSKIPTEIEERKLFTQRKPPYVKSCSAPNLPVQKLEVVKNEGNEQCEVYRLPKTPKRLANLDSYENPDEDLYRKSLLTNHANKGNKNSQITANQCNDHFCLPKTPTSVTKDDGYANSDEHLHKKSPLTSHTIAETKLPALTNHRQNGIHSGEIKKMSNLEKNVHGSELVQKRNRKFFIGAFPNTDVCLVQKSRHKTACEQKTPKSKNAWNSPGPQRRQVSNALVHDVCVIDTPRTRAKTICEMDSQFSEYGPPKSNTESSNVHPGCLPRPTPAQLPENARPRATTVGGANDFNWQNTRIQRVAGMEYCRNLSISSESLAMTEDESIAIKGKFRQIGHSVLAIAFMKKMGKNRKHF